MAELFCGQDRFQLNWESQPVKKSALKNPKNLLPQPEAGIIHARA
jgi:hypothetical protein